jgi:FtsP/CotA-like multicopper oxidase with cupredoxin domain
MQELKDESRRITRRNFVGLVGAAGLGAASATVFGAAANSGDRDRSVVFGIPTVAPSPEQEHAGHDMGGTNMNMGDAATPAAETTPATSGDSGTSASSGSPTADEMDAMHEAGVKAFPAKTEGLGGQPLEYTMDGDVKVFNLTCDIIQWEYEPGKRVEAWSYNGVVPGPEIRVTEGDKIRVNVTNNLRESTAIHWHGLMLPNNMDGVPFMTQPPIKPGESFTYEFPIREGNAGSHMYHSHSNSAEQVTKGLLGPFIVEPKDPTTRPAFDREYTLILNDGPIGGFTINGKGFPATQPLMAKKGEKILIRYMNEGLMIHPMHLHGMPMLVIAHDGYLQPQPYKCDTINIAPGQRFEVIVDATEVGVWAFHCHILSHAESNHGMFGMVTAMIVEE